VESRPSKSDYTLKKEIDSKQIRMVFFGDTTLGGEFILNAEKHSWSNLYPFKYVEKYFGDADVCVMNLEGPLAAGDNKRPGVTTILYNHPDLFDYLQSKGTFVMNLANNHVMDYGPDGLRATIAGLEERGIYHVGAGMDLREASQGLVIDVKGLKIGFLAYTSNEPYIGAVIASDDTPGCASFLDFDEVTSQIKSLKAASVDIICILMHWGHEYHMYPSSEQVRIAHLLVDEGANLVIGHHPHVVQGIEKYKKSVIMYSLGNFFLPAVRSVTGRLDYRKRVSKEFLIARHYLDGEGEVDSETIGGKVSKDYFIRPFDDKQQNQFMEMIENLSRPIGQENYVQFWEDYKCRRERELIRESFVEVFKKLSNMSFSEAIKVVTLKDIKRNIERIQKILLK
jgi:hypothetical protein